MIPVNMHQFRLPVRQFIEAFLHSPDRTKVVDHMAHFESLGYARVYLSLSISCQVEAERWCMDNIGLWHFDRTGAYWWFDRPEDATLFALRWS